MEEVKEQGTEQVNTSPSNVIREAVQKNVKRKEDFLKARQVTTLSALDMEDNKKLTDAYKAAIDRNDEAIDFIMDIKNDIFRIKLIKDKLDHGSALYMQQVQQIDYHIKLLNDILSIIQDERSKMDRVVRYYERNFVVYKDY